jgi:di-heme oxidoreductase (putative peroxidase)
MPRKPSPLFCAFVFLVGVVLSVGPVGAADKIGQEKAVPVHLQDGEEYQVPIDVLIRHGRQLFDAMWTVQEGAGRPLSKGTGPAISDSSSPLTFPRNFNRVSGPDTNSCSGCHNKPFDGGGGDIVANVFVTGQRFDFATFDGNDAMPLRGAMDEQGHAATLQTIANSRKTIGMYGSGYLEMVARQITADLQAIRNKTAPGTKSALVSKGIPFGFITHRIDGTWDISQVSGLAAPSLATSGTTPPSLIIRPYHQAGNVISIRQFTNNAFNHHHGIQSEERFGVGVDADGDGFVNEMTRADVTAATLYQITLPVPGRVVPNDPEVRQAIVRGAQMFDKAGCSSCHVPALPITQKGWIYSEPGPYNPTGNLRVGDAPTMNVDLNDSHLPSPRLNARNGVVWVPAFTDLKIHNITSGPNDPNCEPIDMNQPAGSPAFLGGNCAFLTRKLWGIANQHSYGHHGLYTTMRESVLSHDGEASASRQAFQALAQQDQDALIEFLKSLQVLAPGTPCTVVDERNHCTEVSGIDP